ncbi:uncharacterized protein LOC143470589 isoform X2 [Clavelina lepadiformis]|uniref:uncharacterized protein LOC143470589 isoform X2 n=1 Tax=Clavelina lepadiformis TaxID=159417 RepID=UPI004043438E
MHYSGYQLTFYFIALQCYECNNAKSNEECLRMGSLTLCKEQNAVCEDQVRHIDRGGNMIIEKRCKQKHACQNNYDQNLGAGDPIQCSLSSITSTCRCCCETDGCNVDLQTCWSKIQVPDEKLKGCVQYPKVPEYCMMQCKGNNEPGTVCTFKCNQGYHMAGESKLTCLSDSTWDHPVPKCQMKTCPPLRAPPVKGGVACSNGVKLRSRCRYHCLPGYGLIGREYVDCVDVGNPTVGKWTAGRPKCKRVTCSKQGPLYHGHFSCTKKRRVGSVCKWKCDDPYEIVPKAFWQNHCTHNGLWNEPEPCCTLKCPPYAVMDLVVVLDQSSSVGKDNWLKMINFIKNFVSAFKVRSDSAHFGVVRYNHKVDEDTQILLNYATDSNQPILDAMDKMIYQSGSTDTGRALKHVNDVMLHPDNGNRAKAKDIVLLLTDGESQDFVQKPAKALRDRGVYVSVIPITNSTDPVELNDIVGPGNQNRIFTEAQEKGFDALTKEFAKKLAADICPVPCNNPFHGHPNRFTPRPLQDDF